VFFRVEIAALPAPIGPGAGETVEDLPRVALRAEAVFRAQRLKRIGVRHVPPQEFRYAFLRHGFQHRGHARLAEIFLGEHVAGDLAPLRRDLNVLQVEDDRPVGIADFARRRAEGKTFVRRLTLDCEATLDTHLAPGFSASKFISRREEGAAVFARSSRLRGAKSRCAEPVWKYHLSDCFHLAFVAERCALSGARLLLLPRPLRENKS